MKNTFLLHILETKDDNSEIFCSVLFGEVTNDETSRFPAGHRVITSPVVSCKGQIVKTKSGSIYVTSSEPEPFVISATEWLIMRENKLSPTELLALRTLCSIGSNPIKH